MNITHPYFDDQEIEQVKECLASGWVTQGPKTAAFERAFGAYHGVSHALATTSCTAALHLATLALDLGPDDEVIVPAFTWITSANCAEYVGAKVVFVDVNPHTYNIDPVALEAALTSKTKAIVAVHLFGLAADMDEILAIARPRGIAVIEDAACATGSLYKSKPVGAIGDIGCFSFHPRKVVTTGEGGMVTTDNDDLAKRVAVLRNHGSSPLDTEVRPWSMNQFNALGYNLRLSDIQAAVGLAQMDKVEKLLADRRAAAAHYTELLSGVEELALPLVGAGEGHSYQSYVVRVLKGGRDKRNAIMEAFEDEKIQTRPGTHAVHRLGYYVQKYGFKPEDFPIAATCEDTTITLPIFPGMRESDIARVVKVLKQQILSS
ncbi:DegT/DnrJ/EryC1/StrS family aminotransferase [Thalassospira sp. SM2505]